MRTLSLILTTLLLVPLSLAAGPPAVADAAAAAPPAPVIISAIGEVTPPAEVAGSSCDQTATDCGLFALDVTFGSIAALPVGEFSAQLFGSARSSRLFGCETPTGVRLPGHDTTVVGDGDLLATRRGFPISVSPGDVTVSGQVFDFFEHGTAPACPVDTYPALYSMLIDSVSLQLTTLGDPSTEFDYAVPGSWSWTGTVPDLATGSRPLLSTGTVALLVQPPDQPGTAARCPVVNGCGRLVIEVDLSRTGTDGLLRGAVGATGRLVRSYGCLTAGGRRLERFDSRVIQAAAFNGGPGKVFTLPAGSRSQTVQLQAQLEDEQPSCPAGSHAVLLRIAVRRVSVTVVAFVDPEQRRTIAVPNRGRWTGRLATGA